VNREDGSNVFLSRENNSITSIGRGGSETLYSFILLARLCGRPVFWGAGDVLVLMARAEDAFGVTQSMICLVSDKVIVFSTLTQ
jgi:hypothetical protein